MRTVVALPPAATPAPAWRARMDRWLAGGRGPALAAAIALLGGAPGLLAMPPIDREEARSAQVAAQMLQGGDYVTARVQEAPAPPRAIGAAWLQAAAVAAVSSAEARDIRADRLPSLLGAMLAAAACAWGAARFAGPTGGAAAGVALAASQLLSGAAGLATDDALLCGGVTLSMAGLGRLYGAARGVGPAGGGARAALWAGQALAALVAGWPGAAIMGAALLALLVADRDATWMRRLGWSWGLLAVAAVAGPWALAVSVASDGQFLSLAVADLAGRLASPVSGWAPPGLHALMASALFLPAAVLVPGAAAAAWAARGEAGARFALAWLAPGWLAMELSPAKPAAAVLPLYGALAWLCAFALPRAAAWGAWARGLGAAISAVGAAVAAALALGSVALAPHAALAAGLTAVLAAGAGGAAAGLLLAGRPARALACGGALWLAAHAAAAGLLAPRLAPFWVSSRAADLLARADLDPRNGLTPGPVAVAGYSEPSLVFLLGATTELGTAADAAEALAEGRPALVEARAEPELRRDLALAHTAASPAGSVAGYDAAAGRSVRLTLWRPHPSAAAVFLQESP